MSGQLTTHVLDLSRGVPAAGMRVQLWKMSGSASLLLREAVTNSDGRLDRPLLEGAEFATGKYELLFHAGNYFRTSGGGAAGADGEAFLEDIPIRFRITDPGAHYHVPLLVAPGGYSTYRGS
ncbi:hydroxyisourate hydrolase [Paenibacillus tengchongensis]|uniref:hydroxyisourate hydrolase n=1 Tax=Paenibacillus tengchongensis TaxID=2608684 RepID=UPI00124EE7F4|nr:hydroxyisourate hydrolase [Paenibacillus tengchongensis]